MSSLSQQLRDALELLQNPTTREGNNVYLHDPIESFNTMRDLLPKLLTEHEALQRKADTLVGALENMDTRIFFPPMYAPREMEAFQNGWNSNDDKWSKQRDAALSKYHEATKPSDV